MNAKDKLKFVEMALSISYKDWERLQSQYAALRTLTCRLAEAAQYATCEKCEHNRCDGLRDAVKELFKELV